MSNNEKIALSLTKFFKNRMILNQKILKLDPNNDYKLSIDIYLDKYIKIQNGLLKEIDNETRRKLLKEKQKMIKIYSKYIVFKDSEINEIINILYNIVKNDGIKIDKPTNIIYLVRGILNNSSIPVDKKWITLFNIDGDIAFSSKLKDNIKNINGKLVISSCESENLLSIKDSSIKQYYKTMDEDIFLLDNLYIGTSKDNYNGLNIFLSKRNNQFKALFPKKEKINKEQINNMVKLKDFLDNLNLDYLKETVYTYADVIDIRNSLEKYLTLDNLDKSIIDEIVDISTNWWIDILSKGIVDCEDDIYFKTLYKLYKSTFVLLHDEDKDEFQKNLSLAIRKGILAYDEFRLSVDLGPDSSLIGVMQETGLNLKFPCNTSMTISTKGVFVNFMGKEEVLYDRYKKTKKI